jgi:tRNA (guanine-N7-)-methyltransferase
MRLKHVKEARELIEKHNDLIIDNTDKEKIDIKALFQSNQPLHIEIGMGKGKFVYEMAKANPNINYIGIEKFDSAIIYGLYKMMEEPLDNLRLVRTDAVDITDLFDKKSIDRIYLNFSDPWPKERHKKRRLTHSNFLRLYQQVLKDQSEIHFKTDNLDLFDYSIESMTEYGMEIQFMTNDLHKLDIPNITTEFEEKFSKQGIKINKLIAIFKEDING